MKEDSLSSSSSATHLNEYQARRLRVTCHYIDKLLGEVERILDAPASKAAFPRYIADIGPAQRRTIEDYIARIRTQLVDVLAGHRLRKEEPLISASHAIHVALGTIDIAIEELKPRHMRGYGEVSEPTANELNSIVGELRGSVSKLGRFLEGSGDDEPVRHVHQEESR